MTKKASSAAVPAVFAFESTVVRVVTIDGEPWFVGNDVCKALGISDARQAVDRLDDDERGVCIVPTPSGNQKMRCINEPGLYRLIFTSRVEAAERFKRWLAHDVLPALRKTGRYEAPGAQDAGAADRWSEFDTRLRELERALRFSQATGATALLDGGDGAAGRPFADAVTHLPIWKDGKRPRWWGDREVRAFIIASHRQITIDQCREALIARVGVDRTPPRSSLGRFWQQFDKARAGIGSRNGQPRKVL